MRNVRSVLICGILGGCLSWAGLVTSAVAEAAGLGGAQRVCDTGAMNGGRAACLVTVGSNAAASAVGTASYGAVSAFVSGGAARPGYDSAATATASFTDSFTFFGGTGVGVVTIVESVLRTGTGSLDFGALERVPEHIKVTQTFTFGTPFSLALSAYAAGSFQGGLSDGGSLLVEKRLESLTVAGNGIIYQDASGHVYNTGGTAGFTAAPEPSAWMLVLIGIGLVTVARLRLPNRA